MDIAEGQEGLQFQLHLGGGVHQLVLNHQLVFVRAQDNLLAEDNFPNLVRDTGHGICVEVHDVLVTAGFVHFSVAVDSQVEALAA